VFYGGYHNFGGIFFFTNTSAFTMEDVAFVNCWHVNLSRTASIAAGFGPNVFMHSFYSTAHNVGASFAGVSASTRRSRRSTCAAAACCRIPSRSTILPL
jgi:hypothetical protein